MFFRLDDNQIGRFPNPTLADEDGRLAIGGELSYWWLTTAYCYGIFPWYIDPKYGPVWYCPHKRFVIFPDEIHISHSMRQLIKKGTYHVTFNHEFRRVIESCSRAQGRNTEEGAWLTDDFIKAYTELYTNDIAVSVEVWQNDDLVGGLYGIALGNVFCGESMFSLAPSASKLALIELARKVGETNGIIDCQFETPHLKSMGGRYISYEEYLTYTYRRSDKSLHF